MSNVRIYRPADIAILQAAFDRVCLELGIDSESSAAEALAAQMFRLFAEGCCDVESIVESLKKMAA